MSSDHGFVIAQTDRSGPHVIVVGAGIGALPAAILLSQWGARVTVLAAEFDHTTSAMANGGLIKLAGMPDEQAPEYFRRNLAWLGEWRGWDPSVRRFIRPQQGLLYSAHPDPDDLSAELQLRPHPEVVCSEYPYTWAFHTLALDPATFMGRLRRDAAASGATFQRERVRDLEEVAGQHRPDGILAAAGNGMAQLWPDPALTPGAGIVRVVPVPAPGELPWLDRQARVAGVDIRHTVLMAADGVAYSIARPSADSPRGELVIGGLNDTALPADPADPDARARYLENVHTFLPEPAVRLVEEGHGEWRAGYRPLREEIMIEPADIGGTPVLGVGGLGGAGMSIGPEVSCDAARALADRLGLRPRQVRLSEVLSSSVADRQDSAF